MCGIARFENTPVTIAGHVKGTNVTENITCNFGMSHPEGYRKFQRALAQAAKFKRPVITFIDTPGAYPGAEAEQRGQGEAIARCLYELSDIEVPVIAVVTGEGGSGGALALGLSDCVLMYEHAVFSVLSPEGFASILWKDAGRAKEAAAIMKLTAPDLLAFDMVDAVIAEPDRGTGATGTVGTGATVPLDGTPTPSKGALASGTVAPVPTVPVAPVAEPEEDAAWRQAMVASLKPHLREVLTRLRTLSVDDLLTRRYNRYRRF
jgi:acetyl-CoA carboxylase alpha subunit